MNVTTVDVSTVFGWTVMKLKLNLVHLDISCAPQNES